MATNYTTAAAVEPRALTALFKNREDADSAYEWLLKNGYNSSGIHLLMSEETRQKFHYAEATEPETTEEDAVVGLETGVAVGGGLGAALGFNVDISGTPAARVRDLLGYPLEPRHDRRREFTGCGCPSPVCHRSVLAAPVLYMDIHCRK